MTSEGTPPVTSAARGARGFASVARVASGGAALTAAISVMGAFFAQRALPVEAAQAVLVEWGATQLGVRWSEDARAGTAVVLRRLGAGAAVGIGAAAIVVGFARATGAVLSIAPLLAWFGTPLALLHAAVVGVRDELLLHGLVLQILRGRPLSARLVACGAASAAWAFGTAMGDSVPVAALAVAALAGVVFSSLWIVDRGAWRACGAHAAWLLATRGAVLTRAAPGAWGGDDLASGWAAAVALVPICALLAASAARASKENSAAQAAVG